MKRLVLSRLDIDPEGGPTIVLAHIATRFASGRSSVEKPIVTRLFGSAIAVVQTG
jgi:hypothetical protein